MTKKTLDTCVYQIQDGITDIYNIEFIWEDDKFIVGFFSIGDNTLIQRLETFNEQKGIYSYFMANFRFEFIHDCFNELESRKNKS